MSSYPPFLFYLLFPAVPLVVPLYPALFVSMPLFIYSTCACPMLPSMPLFGSLSRQRFTVHTDVPVRICVLVPDLAPASVHATVSAPFSVHITLYDSVPVPSLVYVIANAFLQIFVPTYICLCSSLCFHPLPGHTTVLRLFFSLCLSFQRTCAPVPAPGGFSALFCLRSSSKYSCCVPYLRTFFSYHSVSRFVHEQVQYHATPPPPPLLNTSPRAAVIVVWFG
jgi:hypothetical protein